jgi:hypothetical protein
LRGPFTTPCTGTFSRSATPASCFTARPSLSITSMSRPKPQYGTAKLNGLLIRSTSSCLPSPMAVMPP